MKKKTKKLKSKEISKIFTESHSYADFILDCALNGLDEADIKMCINDYEVFKTIIAKPPNYTHDIVPNVDNYSEYDENESKLLIEWVDKIEGLLKYRFIEDVQTQSDIIRHLTKELGYAVGESAYCENKLIVVEKEHRKKLALKCAEFFSMLANMNQ